MIGSWNHPITGVQLQLCRLIRAKYSSLCTNHIWGNCNCYEYIKKNLDISYCLTQGRVTPNLRGCPPEKNSYARCFNLQQDVSIFFYFSWLSFYRSVKLHYRKNRATCCVRARHEKMKKFTDTFVPYLSGNVLTSFHGKSSNLHTLSILWNVSLSFWSWRLMPPLESKSQNNIILSNSTFYNIFTDI